MTPEMAFECLLVSHDPAVFCTMDRILQDFSIHTNVCQNPSRAANLLAEGNTDLIVIDLESRAFFGTDASDFRVTYGAKTDNSCRFSGGLRHTRCPRHSSKTCDA